MNGKNGTIEIKVGTPERIHKDKNGNLLIVSWKLAITGLLLQYLFLKVSAP